MEEDGSPDRQTEASLPDESPREIAGISPANPKLWTMQEDDRLKAAVKEFGNERIDWKEVQQKFKLRAAKSCRLRWENQLKPDIDHSAFDPEEDALVLKMQQNEGNKWSLIAQTLTDSKRNKYAEEGTHEANPGTPYRRTDNQVKNRWHSALEKVVKNGKSGHGFTDTEFEAEALRRIESERRLLVTPLGEELRLSATRNGYWEVRLRPADSERLKSQKRRLLDDEWTDHELGPGRRGRHHNAARARSNCIQDSAVHDFEPPGDSLTGFMDLPLDGQCSSTGQDTSFLGREHQLAVPGLSNPFPPLPDVFAGDALHSVEQPSETPFAAADQLHDPGSLELTQGPRFEIPNIPFDGPHHNLFSDPAGAHSGQEFALCHQAWSLDASDEPPPSLPALTGQVLHREDLVLAGQAQAPQAGSKPMQPELHQVCRE